MSEAPDAESAPLTAGGLLLVTCACAVALLMAPAVGGLVRGPAAVLSVLLVSAMSVALGSAIVPLLRLPRRTPGYMAAAVIGYCAVSAVHLTATAFLNLDAPRALVVDLVVAVASVVLRRFISRDEGSTRVGIGPALAESAVLVVCGALTAFWARQTILAVPQAASTDVFSAWQDYFLHASEITYLRDYPWFARQSQYMTGLSQPLYHRGSYALSGLVSYLADLPSLGVATAYWMPTGLLLAMCATYVLGSALGGAIAGVGAVVAVFLVPDASTYGLKNHFMSFHWLMQMAAGSGYALTPVIFALVVLVTTPPDRRVRGVATVLSLVAGAALFRTHVALLAGGTCAWWMLLVWKPRLTRAWSVRLAAAAVAAVALLLVLERIPLAPHFLSVRPHPIWFFELIHTQERGLPTPYTAWVDGHGALWTVVVGFTAMLVAGIGVWLGVLVLAWRNRISPRIGGVGAVPVAVLLSNLSIILFVPPFGGGDLTEFGQRPFVLVYLVFGALAGAAIASLLHQWCGARFGNPARAWVPVGLCVLVGLSVPWTYGSGLQQWWRSDWASLPLSHDAREAGEYLRTHANRGDQLLAASYDPFAIYVSLAERPAYLSRATLYQGLGGAAAAMANARLASGEQLAASASFDELKTQARALGVSWYIADTPAVQLWPAGIVERCAFCADHIRVYDLR